MVDPSKFFALLKLNLVTLTSIAVALGFVLFLPEKTAADLGINVLRTQYRSVLGVGFIFSSSLVVFQFLTKIGAFFLKGHSERKKLKLAKRAFEEQKESAIKRLHDLSPNEKLILCGFILGNTRTQDFSIQDGNVIELCNAGIIYRSASLGNLHGRGFAHNIKDWAWSYLHEHPQLITEGAPTDGYGKIARYRNRDNIWDD